MTSSDLEFFELPFSEATVPAPESKTGGGPPDTFHVGTIVRHYPGVGVLVSRVEAFVWDDPKGQHSQISVAFLSPHFGMEPETPDAIEPPEDYQSAPWPTLMDLQRVVSQLATEGGLWSQPVLVAGPLADPGPRGVVVVDLKLSGAFPNTPQFRRVQLAGGPMAPPPAPSPQPGISQ